MHGTVKKWGNSAAVRIPASVMEAAQFRLDDDVDMRVEGGRIVIDRLRPRGYDLGALVSGITPENMHAEESFGPPLGREAL